MKQNMESISLNNESKRKELLNTGYIVLDSSSTDFHALMSKDPMILDSGAVVFLCLAGKGKIVVDMNTFQIERGSFVLLLPYSVIQITEASKDIEITLVATGFEFLNKLVMLQPVEDYMSRIRENPCLLLTEQQLEEVKQVYRFIEKRYDVARGPLVEEIHNTLMTYLSLEIVSLYTLNQSTEKRKLSRHEQIFRNFTFSLSKNFREQRRVEFYAEEAYLTPKHFSTVIKQRSGKLPTEWIVERTILYIKFLLDNTDKSIQEISNELNFPNQSFFTRYFKNYTETTPTAYKKRTI